MEPSEPRPTRKEKIGFKKILDHFKDVFRDKPTTAAATTSPSIALPLTPSVPTATPAPTNDPAAVVISNPSVSSSNHPSFARTTRREQSCDPAPVVDVDDEFEHFPKAVDIPIQSSEKTAILEEDSHDMPRMRFSHAQAIFAKYNIELSEAGWDTASKVPFERVHKNIRMRVRYTCHNCTTTFGHDRICIGCQHHRCAQCSRYPPKKDRDRTKPSQRTTSSPPPPTTTAAGRQPEAESAVCHECQTGFDRDDQACPNCHHRICERCLRESTITVEHSPDKNSEPALTEEGVAGIS